MPKRIHCGFLVAVLTRMSKDERRRLNEQATQAGISLNVLVRRRLGLTDGAVEDATSTTQTRAADAAQEATTATG